VPGQGLREARTHHCPFQRPVQALATGVIGALRVLLGDECTAQLTRLSQLLGELSPLRASGSRFPRHRVELGTAQCHGP
jgi:hypothetical protein